MDALHVITEAEAREKMADDVYAATVVMVPTCDHAAVVAQLEAQHGAAFRASAATWLREPSERVMLAAADRSAVLLLQRVEFDPFGSAVHRNPWRVHYLSVAPAARRHGRGAALLNTATALGYDLTAAASTPEALKTFVRAGFRMVLKGAAAGGGVGVLLRKP